MPREQTRKHRQKEQNIQNYYKCIKNKLLKGTQ